MRSPHAQPFDARFAARLIRLQAVVITAFASGSLTAGLLNLGGMVLVYTVRHIQTRRRHAHTIISRPARPLARGQIVRGARAMLGRSISSSVSGSTSGGAAAPVRARSPAAIRRSQAAANSAATGSCRTATGGPQVANP